MENIDIQQQQAQQQQIQKIISESPRKKCSSCGCEHFDTATAQVEVSSLLSGTGKNEILLVGVLVCRKCGAEVQKPLITA